MSPHTVHSYRDTVVLLLRFIASTRKVEVCDLADIQPDRILAFLAHLEKDRGNSATTRNVRLAAIHAFFRYVGAQHPDHLEQAQRILGVPARVQEVIDLRANDLQLTRPYQLRLFGKGRKERYCPLWPQTAQVLMAMCDERSIDLRSDARVFLNHRGVRLTRFGVRYILTKHIDRARPTVASLARKRLHPHSMRHSTAVALLKSGVDLSTISQWLGHASPTTANRYATLDLDMKRDAINRVKPIAASRKTAWRASETVLQWLENL